MAKSAADPLRVASASPPLLPLWIGGGVYLLLLWQGNALLRDPDTLWQIRLGRDIISQRMVPFADAYSFTLSGAPWISTQWLAQVLYALAERVAGWSGVVALASGAIALTFALMTQALARRLPFLATISFVTIAFALCASHLLARPHVLALPVMVAWVAMLIAAADRTRAPSFWWLPLMALWANLHGGFVFGLALIAPIGLDAVLNAQSSRRRAVLTRWVLFGAAALMASCITPYGWHALLASKRILELGDALRLIGEWRPADFSRFGLFEACLLGMIGLSWWRGITLPLLRIVLLLGLVHMALAATRNQEVFALLAPLVIAAPLARQIGSAQMEKLNARRTGVLVAGALTLLLAATAVTVVANRYAPDVRNAPVAAVDELQRRGLTRVFNDYDFGGYLIARGIPTFIDGRTELYGTEFMTAHNNASGLIEPDNLYRLLSDHRINATLMRTQSAATKLLDRMDGWQKIYADDIATIHLRKSGSASSPATLVR